MINQSFSYKVFSKFNYLFLGLVGIICLLPIVHVLALSFSSSVAAASGEVGLWPVNFTLAAYKFVLAKKAFMGAFVVSVERVVLGTFVNMFLTILLAYPLSKEVSEFRFRTIYAWVFVFTILFSGGLIPWYMTIKATGLIDSLWALILPSAVPVFNVILLLNFFRGLPKELEEAAFIDGAGHLTILWKIFVPISVPALVTILLFVIVNHWNAWFDGILLMNRPENYPLSSYLQTVLIAQNLLTMTPEDAKVMSIVSDRTAKAAQIFIGALPILCVYPFIQKYFTTGLVLGSVKG